MLTNKKKKKSPIKKKYIIYKHSGVVPNITKTGPKVTFDLKKPAILKKF